MQYAAQSGTDTVSQHRLIRANRRVDRFGKIQFVMTRSGWWPSYFPFWGVTAPFFGLLPSRVSHLPWFSLASFFKESCENFSRNFDIERIFVFQNSSCWHQSISSAISCSLRPYRRMSKSASCAHFCAWWPVMRALGSFCRILSFNRAARAFASCDGACAGGVVFSLLSVFKSCRRGDASATVLRRFTDTPLT